MKLGFLKWHNLSLLYIWRADLRNARQSSNARVFAWVFLRIPPQGKIKNPQDKIKNFRERLRSAEPILYDGGFGSQLFARGIELANSALANDLHPTAVIDIHSDYINESE